MNQDRKEFIFAEMIGGTLKKVRSDLMNVNAERKKLLDLGLAPNNEIYAYERLKKDFYNDLVRSRDDTDTQYFDYFDEKEVKIS